MHPVSLRLCYTPGTAMHLHSVMLRMRHSQHEKCGCRCASDEGGTSFAACPSSGTASASQRWHTGATRRDHVPSELPVRCHLILHRCLDDRLLLLQGLWPVLGQGGQPECKGPYPGACEGVQEDAADAGLLPSTCRSLAQPCVVSSIDQPDVCRCLWRDDSGRIDPVTLQQISPGAICRTLAWTHGDRTPVCTAHRWRSLGTPTPLTSWVRRQLTCSSPVRSRM